MVGSAAAGSMGGGDVRVSLTGEVLEVAQPTQRGTGPGGYGPPPGAQQGPGPRRPNSPTPSGASRARGAGLAYEQEPKKTNPVGIILLVLLIAGGGVGGWWWYNNRTNPKDQAIAIYNAFFKEQDYKKFYALAAFNDTDKKKYPDADTFTKDGISKISSNPAAKAGLDKLKDMLSDITVGEPTITGGKADVPTSTKLTIAGQNISMKGTAHMIKEGGIWKLDLTGPDQQNAMAIQDMIGKPAAGSMGAGMGMPGGSR